MRLGREKNRDRGWDRVDTDRLMIQREYRNVEPLFFQNTTRKIKYSAEKSIQSPLEY